MTLENAFGEVLRELRTKEKLSQEKLAQEGDLDRTFISLLERGMRQPSLNTVFSIAKVLRLPPDELVRIVAIKFNSQSGSN